MRAFHFGEPETPLYGVHHAPPLDVPGRRHAVVLCYPLLAEYMRVHRGMVMLAESLARSGFDVLRFDYRGCGDSAGDVAEATLTQWRQDICLACDEIASIAATRTVSAVGLRGGAALLASTQVRLHRLVLWDPILEGKTHLDSWIAMHRDMLEVELAEPWTAPNREEIDELLGYPINGALREELDALELPRDLVARCRRGNLVYGSTCRPCRGLDSDRFRVDEVDFDPGWDRYRALHRFLLPQPAIQRIVSLFEENAR